ncbi:MAG TPA: BamA/TamA family outer membrane protein [Bacteroidia bacterium]|nr:BamA/TamA family outer membrane protein [Bacteroidia bacterium]HRH09750.1 BamA/TamA family outer membrane protein [Bacteroidia bacterium]
MNRLHVRVFFIWIFSIAHSYAQLANDSTSNKWFYLKTIHLEGNKKTKDKIIFREIPLQQGDSINSNALVEFLKKSQQNIMNTSLFNFVTVDTLQIDSMHLQVNVKVVERWYLWPNPIFEIAERNFNTWLENPNFYRVSYGFYLVKNNFRGRKENIQFRIRLGYAEQYGFAYNIPYLTKKQNLGLGFSFAYSRNHEIQYASIDNKQVFYKNPDSYVRQELGARIRLNYRIGIYGSHSGELRYNEATIADTIRILAPNYLGKGATKTQFFSINFQLREDQRDYKPYPLQGFVAVLDLTQVGFGILKDEDFSIFRTELQYNRYDHLFKRFYLAEGIKLKLSPNAQQPYFVQRGLGFSDFVRGYELYVIDGQNYGLLKTNVKYQLVKPHIQKLAWVPSEKFSKFHYAFYVNLFADAGYVVDSSYESQNKLANKLIYSTGLGLDMVTYYDLVFRIEATINAQNKSGIFLHLVAPI